MREQLLTRWRAEERHQPEGWDFADLAGRMSESSEPWDLAAEYRAALRSARRVLDMGTGGGEYLLRFAELLPSTTVATEGWAPNLDAARRNLSPLGIKVVAYGASDGGVDAVRMPFEDDCFDVVLNRHESYSPRELARVIEPGGVFLTQQVGGDECGELGEWLGHHRVLHRVNFTQFREDLEAAGFEVVAGAQHDGAYTFHDVSSLLAYLQRVPWELPDDFTVDRYADRLLKLHEGSGGAPLTVTRKRFWLKGRRTSSDSPNPLAGYG